MKKPQEAARAALTRERLFESAPVRVAVARQVIPAVASQMAALLYSMADTFFIGLLGLPAQTAAVHIANPSFMFLTAISNLFGMGGASVIARALGRREHERAAQTASLCCWTGALAAALPARGRPAAQQKGPSKRPRRPRLSQAPPRWRYITTLLQIPRSPCISPPPRLN